MIACASWAQDGAALFEKNCASCHRPSNNTRAPLREALARMPRAAILAALETGSMKTQGAALTVAERGAITGFLSTATMTAEPHIGFCSTPAPKLTGAIGWNGWGVDLSNTRFQPSPGLTAQQVPALKLKWAFGFPKGRSVFGQPAIAGGRLFFGSEDGTVYSLDARTGCTFWIYKASSQVRTAISVDSSLGSIYFGDVQANAYRLDAETGALVWKIRLDEHPMARITGAPKLYAGRLYVPVSSTEEVSGGSPKYPCCTFRGSVAALDAGTGKQIWHTYMIPDPPKATRLNSAGVQMMGPAGCMPGSDISLARKIAVRQPEDRSVAIGRQRNLDNS